MPDTEVPAARERDQAIIACGLRTLEAEAGGLAALTAAVADGLGPAFVLSVNMMQAARGRVIVSGMGKSGQSPEKSPRRSHLPARRRISSIRPRRATAISA